MGNCLDGEGTYQGYSGGVQQRIRQNYPRSHNISVNAGQTQLGNNQTPTSYGTRQNSYEIKIRDGDTGYDYESILAPCLDGQVTEIVVEDPYIIHYHQILNFFKFCETVVKHCPNLKLISLITCSEEDKPQGVKETGRQEEIFSTIISGLQDRGIHLRIEFQSTLHDREIRFNNGWICKIGRGLDIFKSVKMFHLGAHDHSLRKCHRTTVNIFKG